MKESDFKTAALIEVNRHILDVAQDSIVGEQVWEFFCECGNRDCHEQVEMTLDNHIALRNDALPVLAPSHQLSQVERARRLQREAQALRAQAQHQTNRARRNLGKH